MKDKIQDFLGFMLFILLFIGLLPILIITGAIVRPLRYFNYVYKKTLNKDIERYYY